MTSGARVREWRKAAGLRLDEAAERVGCSPSLLSQIENGLVAVSKDQAPRLSAASGGVLAVADLLYPGGLPEGAVLTSDKDTESA
jgi:transcriptional regulator with XRE-family HTH domain